MTRSGLGPRIYFFGLDGLRGARLGCRVLVTPHTQLGVSQRRELTGEVLRSVGDDGALGGPNERVHSQDAQLVAGTAEKCRESWLPDDLEELCCYL